MTALSHQEPDRVPCDCWMTPDVSERLRARLGLSSHEELLRFMVQRQMEAGKPGGGFIISTAHNIPPETPAENVIALFEAYKEFGGYGC